MNDFAIAPAPVDAEPYVSLTRSTTGTLFEKHILNYGTLLYPKAPGGKVEIDDAFVDSLIENFENKVCDIVQFPKAGKNNEHSEDPIDNLGEVVGLTKRGGKVYAQIDVRDPDVIPKMGKTILGASAMMNLDYPDTRTGKRMGPTLLHVAATNRPYVTELDGYAQVIAASADGDTDNVVVLTTATTKEKTMSLEELKAEMKADHGIDVDALLSFKATAEPAVALSNAVRDALITSDVISLSADAEPTTEDVQKAVEGLVAKNVELTNEIDTIHKTAATEKAEAKVDGLIKTGHILPKQRDAFIKIALSNAEDFDSIVPEKPIVEVKVEGGTASSVALSADGGEPVEDTVDGAVERALQFVEAKAVVRA